MPRFGLQRPPLGKHVQRHVHRPTPPSALCRRHVAESLESRLLLAGSGLRGEYFSNEDLTDLQLIKLDSAIDFAWQHSSPDPLISADHFSVRWTGQLEPPSSQTYAFHTLTDDGARLWIDGQLLIDAWDPDGSNEASATIALDATRHYDLRLEFRDATGPAAARLLWSAADIPKQVVPQSRLYPTHSEPPTANYFEANGLRVLAESLGDGLFRIDARPALPGSPSLIFLPPTTLTSGNATATFTTAGDITLHRDGQTLWTGRAQAINYLGRDPGPGSAVVWTHDRDESIVGFGEQFGAFNMNTSNRVVEMWNKDVPGQGATGASTYFTAPVLYSSKGYGLFATDNPEGVFFFNSNFTGVNQYQRAETHVTFFLAAGEDLADLVQKRATVQGAPRNVPDWAWAPWISKNSYENQAEAIAAIEGSVARGLPVGAIVHEAWKGGHWLGDFNNFATDRYWDLNAYFNVANANGVKTVLWQVPVIHPDAPEYQVGVRNKYFVRAPDGSVRLRQGWFAGWANIDFTNPAAVEWWKDMVRPEVRLGVVAFKADDGEDIQPTDVFFDGRRGWQVHNEYSNLQLKALMELLDEEGVDGMLWARSASLGVEATPALWAGDQGAEWVNLPRLVRAGLSAGLSGMPFWGHDIGGYWGTPTPELYIRWTQLGALSPMMQYHGQQAREPWLFGQQALDAYRTMSHLRMNLRPVLKALGEEAAATGLPIMRPMMMHYPDDPRYKNESSQYMLGPDLLVAPILSAGLTSRIVKFPPGRWHHALTNTVYEGPADISVPIGLSDAPLFLREDAELPVELAPGEMLGNWQRGAPVRTYRAATAFTATPATDKILLRLSGDGQHVEAWLNRTPDAGGVPDRAFARSMLSTLPLEIAGANGADTLTIDMTNGNPVPEGGLIFAGGAGTDTASIVSAGGNDRLTFSTAGLTLNGRQIWIGSAEVIRFSGGDGDDELAIDLTDADSHVTGAIHFDAGDGAADALAITGGGIATASYTPNSATAGSGTFSGARKLVRFTGLEGGSIDHVGSLTVTASNAPDDVRVEALSDGRGRISGTVGQVPITPITFSATPRLSISAGADGGADAPDVITVHAADNFGLDSLYLSSVNGSDHVVVASGSIAIEPIAPASAGAVSLSATGDARVTLLAGDYPLTALNVSDDARVVLAPGAATNLTTATLSITGAAALDLRDNDLSVANADPAAIRALIASARNATPRWSGPGITSTLAQSNPLTGLATFGGTPNPSSILIKLTYNGDANDDGRINADDYFRIDQAFLAQPPSPLYADGDFNYDGRINADDYFLIDQAFLGQGAPLTGGGNSLPLASTPTSQRFSIVSSEPGRKLRKHRRRT